MHLHCNISWPTAYTPPIHIPNISPLLTLIDLAIPIAICLTLPLLFTIHDPPPRSQPTHISPPPREIRPAPIRELGDDAQLVQHPCIWQVEEIDERQPVPSDMTLDAE